jgi:membrane carboxypeptidase/penicillin-binding protein
MRYLKIIALTALVAIAMGVIGAVILVNMALQGLPDHQKLANYQPAVSSTIYSSDGRQIGLFARQNRSTSPLSKCQIT